MRFKVGDKVRFIDEDECSGCFGLEGIVESLNPTPHNFAIKILKVISNHPCKEVGETINDDFSNYELISPAKKKETITYGRAIEILKEKENVIR